MEEELFFYLDVLENEFKGDQVTGTSGSIIDEASSLAENSGSITS